MGEEKIGDIISKLNLIPKPSSEPEIKKQESGSIWLERNIERFPIYFTGSEKAKREIEKKISEIKEPLVIAKKVTEAGHKILALVPTSVYGLMDGDDAKVVAAVFQYLQEEVSPKLGYTPKRFLMPMKEFCKIMFLRKGGKEYKRIIRSLETVSSCVIIQDSLFETRTERGTKVITVEKKNLHILRLMKIRKEDRKTHRELKNKEYFVEIELEDWMVQNLENYYATKIDKELYFERLNSQRSRKLYSFLTMYNYQKETEIDTSEIVDLLWIMHKEEWEGKRDILRAIEPLKRAGFLETYFLSGDKIRFVFTKVRHRGLLVKPEEKARVDSITLKILEEMQDRHSERFYRLIARKVPENIIFLCLSEIKDMARRGQIKQSKRAAFVDMIARECEKRNIKVPFRQRKTPARLPV